jgi:hypothetical protein
MKVGMIRSSEVSAGLSLVDDKVLLGVLYSQLAAYAEAQMSATCAAATPLAFYGLYDPIISIICSMDIAAKLLRIQSILSLPAYSALDTLTITQGKIIGVVICFTAVVRDTHLPSEYMLDMILNAT